jgi:ankyrin repeat protein
MLAAAGGAWLPGLKLLFDRGGDVNAVYRGYRPLHSLLQEDAHEAVIDPPAERLDCLAWLLASGANPELLGAWPPARALVVAAFAGSPVYVDRLKTAGALVDDFASVVLGDRKRVEKLLAKRPDFAKERDTNGMTALHYASGSRIRQEECCAIARQLLDAGADPALKVKSWSHDVDALYLAGASKNTCIFELLMERGADPHEALSIAIWNWNPPLLGIAMKHGANPDRARAGGQPLLNNLIRWGQMQPAIWLLKHGASPNLPDDKGWTAVHQAASRGNEKMLRAVLEHGGDPNARDKSGDTPLDVAHMQEQPKMIGVLEARGAK